MRIAMIAPVEMRVPPTGYGGTELIVSLLTEELVRQGHAVTLFASGDSVTRADLASVCPKFLRGSGRDGAILTLLNVVSCLERANDFDIIHNHTRIEGMLPAGLTQTPVLSTLHGGFSGDRLLLFNHYKGWYNTISYSAKSLLPPKERFAGVIYNAIDWDSYPFQEGPRSNDLLFLSRICREKGTHLAIQVARQMNQRLIIAGNVHPVDQEYFQSEVIPHVDGKQILYVGEADYTRKRQLLSGVQCLLAPITWSEPFGLFLIEAMACGTPVVALNRGSVPEVVQDGVTGFVVDRVEDMAKAVRKVPALRPADCRQYVEKNFNVSQMARNYLAAYHYILEQEGALLTRDHHVQTSLLPLFETSTFRDTSPASDHLVGATVSDELDHQALPGAF